MRYSMAEAVEVPSWLKSMPLAPEFRPTEAEFADPVAYISKIEPEARSYGICKIVPPFPRVPKKTVMDNLNRSLLLQLSAEGEVDNGPGGRALLTPLGALQLNSGSRACRGMDISVSSLNSRKLLSPVVEGGELKAKFSTRCQQLGCTSPGRSKGSPQTLTEKRVWQSGESYTLEQFEAKAKQFSRARLKTAKDLPALVIESLFWKATTDKSITVEYGNDILASAFGEPADSALETSPGRRKRKYTEMVSFISSPSKEGTLETKEEERGPNPCTFVRRKIQSSPETPRRTTRSCKETSMTHEETTQRKQITSPDLNCSPGPKLDNSYWNMRVMARAPGSLLRYMPYDIPGITSPIVHIGMLFSWFAWHVEDHELQSVNYLHTGAPKTWYAVPGDAAPAFEEVVCMYGYGNVHEPKAACALLGERTTVMSPEVLVSTGVPCCRLVQNAGDFVVTFPRAYHIGFCHGFNCGEAANIASPGWLEVAQDAAIRRSSLNFLPMLSHQQLLYLLALSFSPRSTHAIPFTPRSTRLKDRMQSLREQTVKAVFVNDFAHLNRLLGLLLDAGVSDCILLKDDLDIVSSHCTGTEKGENFSKENEDTNVHNEIAIGQSRPLVENAFESSTALQISRIENLSLRWGTLPCAACGLLCFPCVALVRPMRAFIKGTSSKEEQPNEIDVPVVSTVAGSTVPLDDENHLLIGKNMENNGEAFQLHTQELSEHFKEPNTDVKSKLDLDGAVLTVSNDIFSAHIPQHLTSGREAVSLTGTDTDDMGTSESVLLTDQVSMSESKYHSAQVHVPLSSDIDESTGHAPKSCGSRFSIKESCYASNQHESNSLQDCLDPHQDDSLITKVCFQSPIESSTYGKIFDSEHEIDLAVNSSYNMISRSSTSSYSDKCPNSKGHALECDPNGIHLYQRKVVEIGNPNCMFENQSFAEDNNPPLTLCVPSSVVDTPAQVENVQDMACVYDQNKCEGHFDRVLTSNEKCTLMSEVEERGLEGLEVRKLTVCEENTEKSETYNILSSPNSLRPHFMCLEHAFEAQQRLKAHGGSYAVIVCHSEISEIEGRAKSFAKELNVSHTWRRIPCRMVNEEEKSLINYALRSDENEGNTINDWVSQLGLKASCREWHANSEYLHQSCKDTTVGSPIKVENVCRETHGNTNNPYVNSCSSRKLSKPKKCSVAGRWCGKVWMNNEVHPALGGVKRPLKLHPVLLSGNCKYLSSEMETQNVKNLEEASVEVNLRMNRVSRDPLCRTTENRRKRVADISVGDLEMLRDTKKARELVSDNQGMAFDLKPNCVNQSVPDCWKGLTDPYTSCPVEFSKPELESSDVDIWQDIDVGCCTQEVMSLDTIPEVSNGSLMVETCPGMHAESHDNLLLPGILRRRPCSVFDGETEPRSIGQERDCTVPDFDDCTIGDAFRSALEPPIPEGLGYSMDLDRKQEHSKVMDGNYVDVEIHNLGADDYDPNPLGHATFFEEAGKYSVGLLGEDEIRNGCLHPDSFGIGSKRVSLHYQKLGYKSNENLGSMDIDSSSALTQWRLSSNSHSSSSLLPCKNRTLVGKMHNKLKQQENVDECSSDDEKSHKGTTSIQVKKRRKRSMDEQVFDYAGFCSDGGISTRLRPRKATNVKVDEEVALNGGSGGGIMLSSSKKILKQPKPRIRKYSAKDTEDEFGAYSCDIDGCTMSFATKQELNVHKRNACTFVGCGKRFGSHKYLLQHRRVHLDDRPLKCPWNGCGMTFKWKWACTEHYRVHTGERPYVCPVTECGRTFRFVSDFSRHKRKTGHAK